MGYDYSLPGAYFITTVTHNRENRLGNIVNGEVDLSQAGKIVQRVWFRLPEHYPRIRLGASVIMPNHFHGIIVLEDISSGGSEQLTHNLPDKNRFLSNPMSTSGKTRRYNNPNVGLSEVVRTFKSFSARYINKLAGTQGKPFWQRGYHDRIIRSEEEWEQIRVYILTNPLHWHDDTEYQD